MNTPAQSDLISAIPQTNSSISWLTNIAGEQLLGVLFTSQHVELQFFSHKLIVYSELCVQSAEGTSVVRQGDDGWRAALCARIGHVVLWVERDGDELLIQFDDHAAICASTRRESLNYPAAIETWQRDELIHTF